MSNHQGLLPGPQRLVCFLRSDYSMWTCGHAAVGASVGIADVVPLDAEGASVAVVAALDSYCVIVARDLDLGLEQALVHWLTLPKGAGGGGLFVFKMSLPRTLWGEGGDLKGTVAWCVYARRM